MQRTVQHITEKLVSRLPENDQYYRLDELREWGFPSYIVQRIKVELERNLAESMIIPKTDWANTQSDAVLDAWQQFVDAIRAEARLPASYGKSVIETAVEDVVNMLVQPRKSIPNVIFGSDDQLSYDEMRRRLKAVVVYPHFAKLIRRYMEKKEIDQLSRERCRKIVAQADQKLTAQYSPLNWAQMLDPLFSLLDGEIDTNLLRLFFEDKNRPPVARQFDLMNDTVSRAVFIEALSSPESLNMEEEEQSHLFEDQPKPSERAAGTEDTGGEDAADAGSPDRVPGARREGEEQPPTERFPEEGDRPEGSQNKGSAAAGEEQETPGRADTATEEENSLNAIFAIPEEEEREGAVKEENARESRLREGDLEIEQENGEQAAEEAPQKEAEPEQPEEPSPQKEEEAGSEAEDGDAGSGEETPMWMRYMSDEEIAEYRKRQEEEAEEASDEDSDFEEEPLIDLTQEDASDREITLLREQLEADRELFVEEIFSGSERAYEEAVEDIAAYDSWRDVSKYIEKDIFKRNLVDMYSEAAVDFTDQLQNYFLDKQNKNK